MKTGLIVGLNGQPLIRAEQPYEGATRAPRGVGWSAPSIGPNRALAGAAKTLRNRTRAAYRNSLLMRSALNKNTINEVGKGFTLLCNAKDDDFKTEINALWRIAQNQLDPWGDLSFGGLCHLAVLSRRMSGEVFIRRLNRRLDAGLKVPLQVELLEADMCPLDLNKRLGPNRRIVSGIEFVGKTKVAYWFYLSHPDDGLDGASLNRLERVPARDVIHHYKPTRPGQVRAEPDTSAALLKDRTFHEYDDTELYRKKERAGYTGALYREDGGEDDWEFDPLTGKAKFADSQAYEERESVQAGTVLRMAPGEKMQLFDGDNTGSGYKDFARQQTLMLAAGQDIPYALLTGDWSGLNDRLVRAFLNEYRRGIAFDQVNLSGFQIAFRLWRWVVETAITVGAVSAPGYAADPWPYLAVDVRPDAWKHLHPEQDINARNKAVSSHISHAEREAAEYGTDLEDNMVRNAKALKRWNEICEQEGVNPGQLGGLFTPNDNPGAVLDEA